MVEVLVVMLIGILLGYIIREKERIIKKVEPLLNYSIYLLLFLIGISIGLREELISSLDTIGLQALLLTVGAIIGSCIASYFCYIWFFRKNER